MSAKLHRLWHAQGGLCTYCGLSTWLRGSGETKRAARTRLGLPLDGPGSGKALRRRMATIEHLQRKADGGGNRIENLAMACHGCNVRRGETPVEDYRRKFLQARSVTAQIETQR